MDQYTNIKSMGKSLKPFVTLLCSNFNSAKWIDGYLEAINNQIEENVRIIFVDAGSTDGSLETIRKFRFRGGVTHKIIEKPGCTVYQAWNTAIKDSTTDYVMNLNTDDRLFNYGLVTAKHLAKQNPDADMIYFPCFVMSDVNHDNIKSYHKREMPFKKENLDEHCICGPFPLLKTSTIKELGYFDENLTISGDYEMWMRMMYAGKKLIPAKEAIGSYYENPEGLSTDTNKLRTHIEEDRAIRRKYMDRQKKVIAFSLWGDNSRYTDGAIHNAELAKEVYPGWECWFYVGKSTPSKVIKKLESMDHCKVIKKDEEGDWTGMFWRFEAAADPTVDVMISRDCDSRLWYREKEAVDEWLQSGRKFHIMRDNPQHNTAILGGMWGVKGEILSNIKELIDDYNTEDRWQTDQDFLREVVYPIVGSIAFTHDEFFSNSPFPGERDDNHFVGQAYAGDGKILDQEEYFQEYMQRWLKMQTI